MLHVHFLYHLRTAHISHHNHGKLIQNPGQNLHFPLIRDGFIPRHLGNPLQKGTRAGRIPEVLIEGLAAMAVVAGGNHDDDTALLAVGLGSSHPLYGLIDILVQRIAAIGSNYNIRRICLDLRHLQHKLAACHMSLLAVPGKSPDYLLLRINHHIQNERQLRLLGSVEHITMNRIVLQDARPGIRAGNELAAMICHNGSGRGNARQDALSAAGEARKEMGLNKALGNQKVSVNGDAVQLQGTT